MLQTRRVSSFVELELIAEADFLRRAAHKPSSEHFKTLLRTSVELSDLPKVRLNPARPDRSR